VPVKKASEYDPVERRIRAAMTLAGVDFKGLADRIAERNLSESTLRRLGADEPRATRVHLRAIAEACELPYEFFTTADFSELAAGTVTPIRDDDLATQLQALTERVDGLQADLLVLGAEAPPRTGAAASPTAGRSRQQRH
jgi:hypothetical protein